MSKRPKFSPFSALIVAGVVVIAAAVPAAATWKASVTRSGGVAYSSTTGDCGYTYDSTMAGNYGQSHAWTVSGSGCSGGRVRLYYTDPPNWAGWSSYVTTGGGHSADIWRGNALQSNHQVDN